MASRSGKIHFGAGHGGSMVTGRSAHHGMLAREMAPVPGRRHWRGSQRGTVAGGGDGQIASGDPRLMAMDDADGSRTRFPRVFHFTLRAGVATVAGSFRQG